MFVLDPQTRPPSLVPAPHASLPLGGLYVRVTEGTTLSFQDLTFRWGKIPETL